MIAPFLRPDECCGLARAGAPAEISAKMSKNAPLAWLTAGLSLGGGGVGGAGLGTGPGVGAGVAGTPGPARLATPELKRSRAETTFPAAFETLCSPLADEEAAGDGGDRPAVAPLEAPGAGEQPASAVFR